MLMVVTGSLGAPAPALANRWMSLSGLDRLVPPFGMTNPPFPGGQRSALGRVDLGPGKSERGSLSRDSVSRGWDSSEE